MIEKDELETFRAQITNERCQVENKILPKTAQLIAQTLVGILFNFAVSGIL